MSHLPQSARTLGSTLLSALPPSVRRVLAALPLGDNKVPTPEAAFHCESVLLTVVGVLHVLAPVFVLRTSFFSGLQRESACADESGAEAIGAALVALIQAVGSAAMRATTHYNAEPLTFLFNCQSSHSACLLPSSTCVIHSLCFCCVCLCAVVCIC